MVHAAGSAKDGCGENLERGDNDDDDGKERAVLLILQERRMLCNEIVR
jgi:hypothetical protein